ncbi:hypothetical protein [Luteimonas saliphila]|uniref:hypothetical protein n=1 Tax=Luteimonas saliphila TaxID=2804919 RepID=UPI00192D2D4B|nr:hypothetical protein [Luteimonas saliphila]
MKANANNARGYWESTELMVLHDQILASAGTRWDDWGRFNPDWFKSPVATEFSEKLGAVIDEEYGGTRLLLVKDPRICRFFPLWKQVLDHKEIKPKIILPVRNPFDVAHSLNARDKLGKNRALLLWLRHVLDAEFATRGLDRAFTTYEGLVSDWKVEVARLASDLAIKWPRWSPAAELDIADFLTEDLRHYGYPAPRIAPEDELAVWVSSVYHILKKRSSGDEVEDSEIHTLDRIRTQFDSTSSTYGIVFKEQEQIARKASAELSARLRQEVERTAKLEGDVAQLEQRSRDVTAELQDSKSELDRTLKQLTAAMDESAQRGKSLGEHTEALECARKELQGRDEKCSSLSALCENLERLVSDHDSKVAALREDTANLRAELDSVNSDRATQQEALEKEIAELRSKLARADERAAMQSASIDRAEAVRTSTEKQLSQLREQVSDRFREVAELTSLYLEAKHTGQQLQAAKAEVEADAVEVNAKLASMRVDYDEASEALERAKQGINLLRQSNELYAGELTRLDTKLAELQSGRCWKLVMPLRVAHAWLRGRAFSKEPVSSLHLLRESRWFDATWYASQYSDVSGSGIAPEAHFLVRGAAEGRNPSPDFDTRHYLRSNPDVAASGLNPLLHFIRYGAAEGRSPRPPGKS